MALTVGAIGVVYGDIGTSVLYAMKEVFGSGHVEFTHENIYGILSIFFWTLTTIISLKYVSLVLRADNHGEGGLVAMLALASQSVKDKPRLRKVLLMVGIFGTCLFYGDGVITPAISVLSAVEGLEIVSPNFKKAVIPLTLLILFALFAVQKRGTAGIGKFFGPITLVWFAVIAILGIYHISTHPEILWAISPHYALMFMWENPGTTFVILGAVVLCVTGGEALYADMGHFGKKPIRLAWFTTVMPALTLNYFGQGALLLSNPEAVKNPFYMMAPDWGLIPLVCLATMATVIASQALITGAFSVTKQVIQLGYLPRLQVLHTFEGGWFPLVIAGGIFLLMITWSDGRRLLNESRKADGFGLVDFLEAIFVAPPARVEGTAVFLTAEIGSVPNALLHNLKHNKVLHRQNLFVTVRSHEVPWIGLNKRLEIEPLHHDCWQVIVNYGFKNDPDLPKALAQLKVHGADLDPMTTSYFLSRDIVIPTIGGGMSNWREKLFAQMHLNASAAAEFLKLPNNAVVELGSKIEI